MWRAAPNSATSLSVSSCAISSFLIHTQRTLPAPRLKSHDPNQCSRSTAANDAGMAFNPRHFWQLSILETAGIATVIVSALLIAGIAYSIWW